MGPNQVERQKACSYNSRTMLGEADIKRQERETYDSIAEAYDGILGRYNSRFAADMVDLLYPQKCESALDVAGGSGAAGLKLAERIGPGGSVVISDLAPEMVRLARQNAIARKLGNVVALVMDAEQLEFPGNSFDIVSCCFGAMSFPHLPRAVSEMKRVLKPGGRIGFAVWSVPERCPLYSEPMTAFLMYAAPRPVRILLGIPLIRRSVLRRLLISGGPSGYSPARLCEEGSLEGHLLTAGFESVRRVWFAHALEFRNFDEYWNAMIAASPAAKAVRSIPERILALIRERLADRLVSSRTGGVRLFNEAGVILAAKPFRSSPG